MDSCQEEAHTADKAKPLPPEAVCRKSGKEKGKKVTVANYRKIAKEICEKALFIIVGDILYCYEEQQGLWRASPNEATANDVLRPLVGTSPKRRAGHTLAGIQELGNFRAWLLEGAMRLVKQNFQFTHAEGCTIENAYADMDAFIDEEIVPDSCGRVFSSHISLLYSRRTGKNALTQRERTELQGRVQMKTGCPLLQSLRIRDSISSGYRGISLRSEKKEVDINIEPSDCPF